MTTTSLHFQSMGILDAAPYTMVSTSPALSAEFNFGDTRRLTAALHAGDEKAFWWLYQEWNDRLVRYCFTVACGNGAEATEIVQATYLRLYRHVGILPDELALWNWMARAARNAATDSHRIGSRYRAALERFTTWFTHEESHSPGSLTDSDAELALFEALEASLEALTEEERSLIEMRYFTRRKLDEISADVGVTVRCVEGRLARLRAKLRVAIRSHLRHRQVKQ